MISVVATIVFIYIIFDTFVKDYLMNSKNWNLMAFFWGWSQFVAIPYAYSLEWGIALPTPFHAFEMLPVQS